uniref:Uncharacterized protein n=1 Tax=Anguilla anguilla TaxID=7936 RepID=A0A0E9VVV5_ANGAN
MIAQKISVRTGKYSPFFSHEYRDLVIVFVSIQWVC